MFPYLIYLVGFLVLLSVVLLVFFQIKTEKEFLKVFSQPEDVINSKIKDLQLENEFFVKPIYLNWIPYTGRYGNPIYFNSLVKCQIYNDFVIFTLNSHINHNSNIGSRIIYKKDIKIKFDIFAGHIIDIKVHNFKMTFQVYNRVDNFKIKSL